MYPQDEQRQEEVVVVLPGTFIKLFPPKLLSSSFETIYNHVVSILHQCLRIQTSLFETIQRLCCFDSVLI